MMERRKRMEVKERVHDSEHFGGAAGLVPHENEALVLEWKHKLVWI